MIGRSRLRSIENAEAKELICTVHGHQISWNAGGGGGYRAERNEGEEKNGKIVIA